MSKRSMLRIAPVVLGLGLSMAVGVPSAIAADAVSASEIVAEPKNNTDISIWHLRVTPRGLGTERKMTQHLYTCMLSTVVASLAFSLMGP